MAPDWQAAPKLAAMPCMSSAMRRASASTLAKRRLVVLGERWVVEPLMWVLGMAAEEAGLEAVAEGG